MQIKEILESKYNLSQKNSELLISHLEQVTYSKKEIIQKADTMDYYIYFVESGLIRSFISRDGREITLWIVPEGGTPISSSGLTKPGISKITIDAVTDCILWRVSRSQLGSLCGESLAFANFIREMAENIIFETEIFWSDYYGLDKKEQYKRLMQQYPELLQRVSLGEIASYLDITPQSLSRIRREID